MATWYQSTRIHDDAMRVAQSVNESQAPLKYLTYGPDYLLKNSCGVGTRGNCSVYSAMDVAKEPRGGVLTDKREINRPTTQVPDKRMYINNPDKAISNLYTPQGGPNNNPINMSTIGQPLSDDQINSYAKLFIPQQFSKPCDVVTQGNYVTNNQFDRAVDTSMAQDTLHERIVGYDQMMRSTRVERRNHWKDNCAK